MIKTLVDLFLLISSDKKTITCNDISTLYQFITKKLPEIENQRHSIMSCSLIQSNINNDNNEKIEQKKIESFIYQNEDIINKINKNIILKDLQIELLSLFNDMIDYIYEENIIALSEDKKEILKNKINKILKDKSLIMSKNKSINNLQTQSLKKGEIRNYLIQLINNNNNNNDINNSNITSFNFSIKNFINFFNIKNIEQNRYVAQKLIYVITPIIEIYKTDIKMIYTKKMNKPKTKSLCKIERINIDNNNNNKNINMSKKQYTTKNRNNNNNNINKFYYKVKNNSLTNKKKEYFNLNNIIIKKKKRKTVNNNNINKNQITSKENIINNYDKNNYTQDTIPCQTLKNCHSFDNMPKNDLYVNYLSNIIKNIKANKNIRINKINTRKIVGDIGDKTNYYYPESHIEHLNNNKKYCIGNKLTVYGLNKKNARKKIYVNDKKEIEIYNINKIGKTNKSSYLSYVNKKGNDFNDKSNGCLIH